MNHAHLYCQTLESVSREKLVNGIHEALMHFYAIRKHESLDVVNINPVILDLERLLAAAGHIGFDGEPVPEGMKTTPQEFHIQNTPPKPSKEEALREIIRRSQMLIHQNTGRWDMTVEHDARSYGVTEGNVRIARQALGEE